MLPRPLAICSYSRKSLLSVKLCKRDESNSPVELGPSYIQTLMTPVGMALEISEATSKLSKATSRIYEKLMRSGKLTDKIQSKWLKNTIFTLC